MVRKYAHLSSEHLSEYVDRLSRLKLIENGVYCRRASGDQAVKLILSWINGDIK